MHKGHQKRERSFVVSLLAMALTCGALVGCAMPVPPVQHRQESPAVTIPEDPVAKFPVGRTTRADVTTALGAPNAAAVDGSWIAYSDRLSFGKWHLYLLPSMNPQDLIPSQGTRETIRYRNLIFPFDAYGRVLEAITETGECEQTGPSSACFETRDVGGRLTLSVDTGVLQASLDRVRARYIPAARREGGSWVEGALVLTDYSLAFVAASGSGAPYRPVLLLPGSAIRSVDWGPEDASKSALPTAVLSIKNGSDDVFDLGGRLAPAGAVPTVPYRQLTERFIDSVRALCVRGS